MTLRQRIVGAVCAGSVAALCLAPALGSAHHSFAMFDQNRQVTVTGVVKEFQWTNPHAFIAIEDSDQKIWSIELNSPNNLVRQGWKRTSLKPGDKVSVVLNPLRNGTLGGLFRSVTLPDGRVLGDPKPGAPINVPTAQ